MNHRLKMLNQQVKPNTTTAPTPKRATPTDDVWVSMGLDSELSAKAAALRIATGKMMDKCYDKLEKHVDDATFPHWIVDEFRPLGINGLNIKGYGSPGLNTTEAGVIIYELAKRDGSIATFFLAHNAIGMAVIDVLGDEE